MRRREFITLLGTSAAAWPLAASAQQQRIPVIGYLNAGAGTPDSAEVVALRAGLADAGLAEGKDYTVEYRWARGPLLRTLAEDVRRMRALAEDLAQGQVAAIVAGGSLGPIRAAMAVTSTTPIVFIYGGDPVSDDIVASMNRPGGNVTGVTSLRSELAGKRLDFLHKLVPNVETIGFLSGTPNFVTYPMQTAGILAAGRELGLKIAIVECRDDRDYDAAFTTLLRNQAGALMLGAYPLPNQEKIVPLAAQNAIPTMYPGRPFIAIGGLIGYGTDPHALNRQAGAQYVARILKGAKPADLPVQQATKFELTINLKTARALGLDVPPMLLALADEVIE